MGGRLSFLAACELPDEIRACAPFYGGGIGALLDRAGRIRCSLHLFFGQLDFFIRDEEVRRTTRSCAPWASTTRSTTTRAPSTASAVKTGATQPCGGGERSPR
jgi:dienelactone hydrolase